ncbi:MAG: alpha/beta fold hydrolase [Nevskia sp.]|nr:alpha/beta fold hydrolase [Nevskia sp.]
MKTHRKGRCSPSFAVFALFAILFGTPAWAYSPLGPVPEALKTPSGQKLWTDDDVARIVESSYVTIDGYTPASPLGAPLACDKLSFLRFKTKDASSNAEDADAAILMVPGILEGASAFDFFGRQLVYIAKTRHHKNIEVWAMDRRSNCLEDHTGFVAGSQAATAQEAEDLMIGYYYKNQPINGRTFQGFLQQDQIRFLSEFGLRQTTQDMYAIIKSMMPTPGVSKKKVILAGHSLGGLHVSAFLSWDFDGNPSTTADAGYNLVAGAVGLETFVSSVAEIPKYVTRFVPFAKQILNVTGNLTEDGYVALLGALQAGKLPTDTFIPGLFSPEVLAMPDALSILATKDAGAQSDVLQKIPALSPEVTGILKLVFSRDPQDPTTLKDYRLTNQAIIGALFGDKFSPLGFLQTGLGFMHGGAIVKKNPALESLREAPGIGPYGELLFGQEQNYIPADAGPDLRHLGTGPLYDWGTRDQIATPLDPDYKSAGGLVTFTTLQDNPSDMQEFIRGLYRTPTDLGEWYFPTRIVLDVLGLAFPWGTKHGLDVYHIDGPSKVPSMIVIGGEGIVVPLLGAIPPQQNQIVAPGFHHVDPMFEAVNSPTQKDYVFEPIVEFMLRNTH